MRIIEIAVALALDSAAGLAGGLLSERWLQKHLGILVGFAAGALVGVAFLDLLPEASEKLGVAGFAWALGAFAASAVLEWRADHHKRHEISGTQLLPATLLASDALHNSGDGAAIAAAFLASPKAGVATAIAVIFHEVPQEVGDYALLRAAGMKKWRALLYLAGVQLTAFIGAALVLLIERYAHVVTAVAVAIAGGTFLYIGATDLLPELRQGSLGERRGRRVAFVVGLVVTGAMARWLA